MKEVGARPIKKVPTLRGRTVINLFFEPSTRTRMSFELAEKRLSADTLGMTTAGSSVVKGETLADTARTLEAMSPDMIVMRHALVRRAASARADLQGEHHQRRRRHARASDAGAARRVHDGRAEGPAGRPARRHRRRPRAQPRAAVERAAADQDGRRGARLRPGHADAARPRPARRARDHVDRRRARRRRRRDDAARAARADARPVPAVGARVLRAVRPHAGAARARRAGRDRHAPGPDEPRRRDRFGSRRRTVVGDPRPGRQRRRRAHGGAVPAGGRKTESG